LRTYDKENIRDDMRREVKVYIDDPEFIPELIKTKSAAAAGLSAWVINILLYVRFCYKSSMNIRFFFGLDFMKFTVKSNQNV
jgi:hypothetical protein